VQWTLRASAACLNKANDRSLCPCCCPACAAARFAICIEAVLSTERQARVPAWRRQMNQWKRIGLLPRKLHIRVSLLASTSMRAAHGHRKSRGPLLLAAAVGAALLFVALRRPNGTTELPQLPQSFLDGVALATSPWPKVQVLKAARGSREASTTIACTQAMQSMRQLLLPPHRRLPPLSSRCCATLLPQNISDLEVLWELPPAPLGVLFLAHGCSHSGSDFWPKSGRCMHCLGLPEEMRVRQAALRRGYAVVAVSSHNRETMCWHNTGADRSEDLKVSRCGCWGTEF